MYFKWQCPSFNPLPNEPDDVWCVWSVTDGDQASISLCALSFAPFLLLRNQTVACSTLSPTTVASLCVQV